MPNSDIALHRPDFNDSAEVLRDNAFAIYFSADTVEDRIARLLALIPLSIQIVEEARETIARLREENERLKGEK